MSLEQLFYINQQKFVCQVVESLCKKKGVNCYTMDEVADFSYLLHDLKPNIVIVEEKTYQKYQELIQNNLQKTPLLVMATLNPLTFFDEIANALGDAYKKH